MKRSCGLPHYVPRLSGSTHRIIIVFLLLLLLFPSLFPYVFRETYKLIGGEPSQSDLGDTFADLLRSANFPANCVLQTHTHTLTHTHIDWSGNCFFITYHHCEHEVPEAKKRMPKEMRRSEKNKTRIRSQLRNDIICGIWTSRVSRSNDFGQTQFITNTHTHTFTVGHKHTQFFFALQRIPSLILLEMRKKKLIE